MKKTLLACLFGLGLGACVNAADVQEINIAYVKAPFNLQNIVMKHNQMMEKEFAKDMGKRHDIPMSFPDFSQKENNKPDRAADQDVKHRGKRN